MIDEESERAVARWVGLADQVITGGPPMTDERPSCVRCGATYRVLDRGELAVCARCYLERGSAERSLNELAGPSNALH